jgi:hypothetical protein
MGKAFRYQECLDRLLALRVTKHILENQMDYKSSFA